jgi:hypothetical protein
MPIVLGFRFDPVTMLDLIEQYKPTFTAGAITVFVALMDDPYAAGRYLSSLSKVYSGVPTSTAARRSRPRQRATRQDRHGGRADRLLQGTMAPTRTRGRSTSSTSSQDRHRQDPPQGASRPADV